MSGYYYPRHTSPLEEEEEFGFSQPFQAQGVQPQQNAYQAFAGQPIAPVYPQGQFYNTAQQFYPQTQPFQQPFAYPRQPQAWVTPIVPSNVPSQPQTVAPFPAYSEPPNFPPERPAAGPSRRSTGYLSPDEAGRGRASRAASLTSNASSTGSYSESGVSRSVSPSASVMAKWGSRAQDGSWRCAYPGCSSRSTFNRGCDLRKHYKRHTKSLFCRHKGCPQATEGGFSSKKDRARHEAKHDPKIVCEWEGCDRLFSRVDNMVRSKDE
ncbi:hypothetical protein LTR37_012545 [Vermiconidia calcicola]|uniref:Uncharacterized protein n=1 Tax=Vermiconidia calcicola TaxID=1690605 RepID=A0ACC3MZ47_9PEZI|nr:hypothetical protein LTR37_012545 [Vermiconidia calcicola]